MSYSGLTNTMLNIYSEMKGYDNLLLLLKADNKKMTEIEEVVCKKEVFGALKMSDDAIRRQYLRNKKVDAAYKLAVGGYLGALEITKDRIVKKYGGERFKIAKLPVPKILQEKNGGEYWDFESLLECVFSLGNAGAESAVKRKYGLTTYQLEVVVHEFTFGEWRIIQKIRNIISEVLDEYE